MNVPKKTRLLLDGVLLFDKPIGYSSNHALIKVKGLLNAQKAGHTGTLDPFASGVLPLCFGEATKFSQDLLDADKSYEAVVHFGLKTTTGDTEGEIVERCEVNLSSEQIERALAQFRGLIQQVPPMYSALKRDGKPLYTYARAGITLERQARDVTIHALHFLAYQAPFLRLRVTCSKGTYIRVLAEDIGAALGCGAHLQELRRIQVGSLKVAACIGIDALIALEVEQRAALLAPVDSLLSGLPAVLLPPLLAKRFLQGQRLTLEKEGIFLTLDPGRVRVYQQAAADAPAPVLLGTAQLHQYGVLAPERLIAAAPIPVPIPD